MHDADERESCKVHSNMNELRHAPLNYLRYVLKETGLSPTALAVKAGMASTTLTRPLNDEAHKFTLSTSTLEKIHRATGINPAPFFEAESHTERLNAPLHDPRTYDPEVWGELSKPTDLVLVVGEVAAGHWREINSYDMPEVAPFSLKPVFYDSKDCFGLIVRGQSLNKIASDGDVLFCVSVSALKHPLRAGSLVIVERTSADNSLIEVTAKRLRGKEGAWELWPESTDPRFQDPIKTDLLDETGAIKVIAEVDCIVRGV